MLAEDHTSYIGEAPEQFRPMLADLRQQIARAVPDAEEVMMYGMPGFRVGTTMVAGYAAFSKQCGLYVSKAAISRNAEGIKAAGLKATKTGVTFSQSKPIPDELITRLVTDSRAEPDN